MTQDHLEPLAVPMSAVPRLLGCGRTKAYDLLKRGLLETVDIGGMRRITMRSIKALAEPKKTEGAE